MGGIIINKKYMKEELKLQLDCLIGEKEAGKLNIIADFIDKYFIEREIEEADLLEARRKHKDLDNRSYLLGYNDAVERVNNLDK